MDNDRIICHSFGDKRIVSREQMFVNRLVTFFLKIVVWVANGDGHGIIA